jgi:hypothetical protein
MSSITLQRVHQNVHQTVHTLTQKKYSEPEFIPEDHFMESVLKLEQSTALSKDWYVYYKFIDDSTGN